MLSENSNKQMSIEIKKKMTNILMEKFYQLINRHQTIKKLINIFLLE